MDQHFLSTKNVPSFILRHWKTLQVKRGKSPSSPLCSSLELGLAAFQLKGRLAISSWGSWTISSCFFLEGGGWLVFYSLCVFFVGLVGFYQIMVNGWFGTRWWFGFRKNTLKMNESGIGILRGTEFESQTTNTKDQLTIGWFYSVGFFLELQFFFFFRVFEFSSLTFRKFFFIKGGVLFLG